MTNKRKKKQRFSKTTFKTTLCEQTTRSGKKRVADFSHIKIRYFVILTRNSKTTIFKISKIHLFKFSKIFCKMTSKRGMTTHIINCAV